MYYLHSYNIGYAARKAGYTTGANCSAGFKALQDPRVKKLMKQIKEIMYTDIYITGRDILNEYIKIAFADMTEFVEFDNRRVKLKNSQDVDGRLITEVKQGKDGVTIKLADKMKAIERLEKLFNVIPDHKLELEREKFEFTKKLAEKETGTGNKVVIINDL
jgi:phage terminase small subunit